MGPKEARSTVLTPEEEAIIVAFRRHALLPLDDCLYGLQPIIPHLTRSSLHRCLERPVSSADISPRDRAKPDGISRLAEIEGDKPAKKRFANYPLGYFHIDLAEVSTEEGKLRLFVAISRQKAADPISEGDRSSRPGRRPHQQVRLRSAGRECGQDGSRTVPARPDPGRTLPHPYHRLAIRRRHARQSRARLTDNGVQFTPRKQDIWDVQHIFDVRVRRARHRPPPSPSTALAEPAGG
jgi:hypothetical protein